MPPYLDIMVIGIVVISALLAMVRGFTREILSIVAWVAAAAAALLLFSHLVPYVSPYIKNTMFANLVAGAVIFLLVLVVVSFFTIRISDMILDSRIGAIDRTLGFLFGAARGFLLAVVAFLFFNWMVPEANQPAWAQQAKSRPVLVSSGQYLLSLMPPEPEEFIRQHLQPATQQPEQPDVDPDTTAPQTPRVQSTPPATPAPTTPNTQAP